MIIDKLIDKILNLGNPTVVGLDPRLSYIPEFIMDEALKEHGPTTAAAAQAIFRFNQMIVDSIHDIIPAVKPQIAMYEQFGADGIKAYTDTISYCKQKGLIVIGDIKRGDIASTAEAYSDGHIGKVEIGEKKVTSFKEDFITLNPYMGTDSIEPFLSNCEKYEKGLFVLVKTSNPSSSDFQDLKVDGTDKTLYEVVGDKVSKWGKNLIGSHGFSEVGAVVGATFAEQAESLRKRMPHTFFLVPGYGAQGAKAKELAGCFNEKGIGAIVNSSRGIIAAHQMGAYKGKYSDQEFYKACREATIDMREDLKKAVR